MEMILLKLINMNIVEEESRLEKENIGVLALTNKEICTSDIANSSGTGSSNSVSIQINKWKETLDEDQRDNYFTFVGFNSTGFGEFKKYILNKYEENPRKKAEWETYFTNPDFQRDIKKLFAIKIYEHKYEQYWQTGKRYFVSPKVHNDVQEWQFKKLIRKVEHEALCTLNKRVKYIEVGKLDQSIIRETVENVMDKYLPDRITEKYLEEGKNNESLLDVDNLQVAATKEEEIIE